MAGLIALQLMQPSARDRREILWLRRGVQGRQLCTYLHVVFGLDTSLRTCAIETFKPIVAECPDHDLGNRALLVLPVAAQPLISCSLAGCEDAINS